MNFQVLFRSEQITVASLKNTLGRVNFVGFLENITSGADLLG